MKKSLIVMCILCFALTYLIVQVTRMGDWWWESNQEKEQLEKEVDVLGVERLRLQRQEEYSRTDLFVEREARDKLNYGREGETVLLMPTKAL